MANQLTDEQRQVLKRLNARYGRRTKSLIRDAWMSGNYDTMELYENDSMYLQQIRNNLGPSWLHRTVLGKL